MRHAGGDIDSLLCFLVKSRPAVGGLSPGRAGALLLAEILNLPGRQQTEQEGSGILAVELVGLFRNSEMGMSRMNVNHRV